jgi:hypothetical protein
MIECESMESIVQPAERELTLGMHTHIVSAILVIRIK